MTLIPGAAAVCGGAIAPCGRAILVFAGGKDARGGAITIFPGAKENNAAAPRGVAGAKDGDAGVKETVATGNALFAPAGPCSVADNTADARGIPVSHNAARDRT